MSFYKMSTITTTTTKTSTQIKKHDNITILEAPITLPFSTPLQE